MAEETNAAKITGKYNIITTIINGLFSIVCVIISAILGVFLGIYLERKDTALNVYESHEYISLQEDYDGLQEDYDTLLSQNEIPAIDIPIGTISEKDQLEIDEIIDIMEYYYNNYDNYFFNLKIDKNEIELLYKLFLCEKYYKYENIILAFESFGIDCNELIINNSLLTLWDMEILYSYIQMEHDVENISDKIYYFNNYKMDNIDAFDYTHFQMDYSDDTFEFIHEDLNNRINNLKLKMDRNSLPLT